MTAGSLISGSRIPPFLIVARMDIQSDSGPLVSSPIIAPIKIAILKNPIVSLEKLYGGAANAWLCVRFKVRKTLADQETLNAASSTIGNMCSFHGIQKLVRRVLTPLLGGCQSLNCCFDGVPLPTCETGAVLSVSPVTFSWNVLSPGFSGSGFVSEI